MPGTEPGRLSVELVAPAKINLALHVTGRRADGYHLLETLVVFAADGDRIGVSPASEDRFEITGPFAAGLPADASNLVARARDLMRRRCDGAAAPVAITLEKNLPVASGLGGGSSDAAATMRALGCAWQHEEAPSTLGDAALALGADLPMCLAARPLVARGIGEAVTPVDGFPALEIVLVNPGVPVSTREIFARMESRANPPLPEPGPLRDAADVAAYLAATRNDLEPAARALAPQIGEAAADLSAQGALAARMTGSGATCFGIFADRRAARRAAERIQARHPGWFVLATRTLPSPEGPADAGH